MKYIRLTLASATLFLGTMSSAHALCYFSISGNAPTTGNHYIYTPIKKHMSFSGDHNKIQIGKAIGIINMTMQSNARNPNTPGFMICGGGSNILQFTGIGNPINGNIYPSNIPGIGYQIFIDKPPYGSGNPSDWTYPKVYPNRTSYSKPNKFDVEIHLIKTGQISCLGPFTGTFAQDMMDGQILGELRF